MMRMRYKLTTLFAALFALHSSLLTGQAAGSDWAERFAAAPADARILKIIHNWPDSPQAQDQQISRLHTQGFGGVVCNVSFDQYLQSDAKWSVFTRAVKVAKEAGFSMWLYDERGYPSGNAGGLTLKDHPEWEARGLLIADAQSSGGSVNLQIPPGKLVLAGAFALRDGKIDLSTKLDLTAEIHDGSLNWQAPSGRWRVMAITESHLYEGTHAEANLHAKIPYINLLQPEPTARFVALTYGGYASHLGNDLSKFFMASFTDEPSLMSLFLRPMPYSPLPWAENLPGEFARRRGYSLETAMLPALVADCGAKGEKFRYDFWQTVGELVSENFFGQIQTRCRKLHIPSGGHLLAEERIASHVPLYGDFFRCIRRLDAPSIDCLTSVPAEVPWHIARLLSSAAEVEGRELVMSETSDHSQVYRPNGDQRPRRTVTEAEIRGTCNREIVAGVNCITSYYSLSGLSDDALRRLNEWVGRCCAAMRGGNQVADIAVLYPTESLWTKFTPSHLWTSDATAANRIDSLFLAAAESLFAARRDFTFVDSRALSEARVEGGALVHGPIRWRVVVLPGTDTLPLAAWKNLATFVRKGGVLIALGALPTNSEKEFPSATVQAMAGELFGATPASSNEPQTRTNAAGGTTVFLPAGADGLLPTVLDGLLETDVKVAEGKSPLRVAHRRIAGREVYLVINDGAQAWTGQLDFSSTGNGERWNPATGKLEETLPASTARLSLEPYGAACFRFATAKPPARRTVIGGALPNLSLRSLPSVEPTTSHGEFVRAELQPDTSHAAPEAPVWRVSGTITKSKVDTHLFARWHFAEPLDFSAANNLVVESWVPDSQSTPSQLLVIVHEQGSGDFIAETGRSLGAWGRERVFLPLHRLQLAGWSTDADGVLDLKRVQDISIGWGGYFGTEGERVEFTVRLPQTGSVGEVRVKP